MCAVVNGGVQCWGLGTGGALGNGSTGSSATPVQAIAASSGITRVINGQNVNCATNGSFLKCWGNGGQTGDGTNSNVLTPTTIIASGVTDFSVSMGTTCAVVNGGLKCWGNNYTGQLGVGNTTDSNVPVQPIAASSSIIGVTVGVWYDGCDFFGTSCAYTVTGMKCWGAGSAIGNGSSTYLYTPQTVSNFP